MAALANPLSICHVAHFILRHGNDRIEEAGKVLIFEV